MWHRHGLHVLCFCAGIVATLLVQVAWRHGRPKPAASPEMLDLSIQPGKTYRVVRVIDGDTLALENGLHVRYAGINTPEKGRFVSEPAPFSEAATRRNRELVEGQAVRLRLADTPVDAHGRIVAQVVAIHPDGTQTDVEAILLKEGLGRAMGLGLARAEYGRLKELQEEARASRLGIWGTPESAGAKENGAAPFCAASGGQVFHRADCPQARRISTANRIEFPTIEAARASGRHACRQCAAEP